MVFAARRRRGRPSLANRLRKSEPCLRKPNPVPFVQVLVWGASVAGGRYPGGMVLRSLAVAAGVSVLLTAQAPPGFKTYENKLGELTFCYSTYYKEVPLPPTEL